MRDAPQVMEVEIECRIAWWWWPYYYGLILTMAITGLEPDWDKVEAYLVKAVSLRIDGGPWRRVQILE